MHLLTKLLLKLLLVIINKISKSFDDSLEVQVIFLCISKALDQL